MFLAETWADEARLKKIKRDFDFSNMFFVDRNNRGRGSEMYWRNSMDLQIDTSSKNHIDAIVNKGKRRFESWNLLRQLNNRFNLPWVCVRNFNELLKSS